MVIKSRVIGYWNRIILGKHTKISYILYQALKTPENVTSKWILHVKGILCDIGRHDLWLHQTEIGSYSARYLVKQTLKDHFHQQWRSNMENSSKSKHYGYIKDSIEMFAKTSVSKHDPFQSSKS